MKYVILKKGFGEGCDYTIGCNMAWDVVELVGPVKACVELTIRECLYGGDENGTPEEYDKITDMDGQVAVLKIISIETNEIFDIDMDKEREKHNKYHDEKEKNKSELAERSTYERLKKKYG